MKKKPNMVNYSKKKTPRKRRCLRAEKKVNRKVIPLLRKRGGGLLRRRGKRKKEEGKKELLVERGQESRLGKGPEDRGTRGIPDEFGISRGENRPLKERELKRKS